MIDSRTDAHAAQFAAKLLLIGALLLTAVVGCLAQGAVLAWGDNTDGQLGEGKGFGGIAKTPMPVVGLGGAGHLTGIIAVAGGSYSIHGLALTSDGTVWAWGDNTDGELGDNAAASSSSPVQVVGSSGTGTLSGITAIAAGNDFSMALDKNGNVWAWGDNMRGQLGEGSADSNVHSIPAQVLGSGGTGLLSGIIAIAAGYDHSMALKSNGTVWTWGYNGLGQLGNNTFTSSSTPVQVLNPSGTGSLSGITAIAAGNDYSLALKSDGTVWDWGNGFQLGQTSDANSPLPVQVLGPNGNGHLGGIAAIASGGFQFSQALKSNGTVWAWGDNSSGQLGNNTTTTSLTPVQTLGPNGSGVFTGVTAIAAGNSFSLALKSDGTVWGWGDNGGGELGNNMTTDASTPTQVVSSSGAGSLSGIAAIRAGGGFALAVTGYQLLWQGVSNNQVYQWLMNQSRRVASAEILGGIASGWKIGGSGSFSGNTTPDILWQNTKTGEVGVWQMNGATFLHYIQIEPPGIIASGWLIGGVGDFNADGSADILWQNETTGEIGYWQMNGTVLVTYHQIEPPGVIATSWQIVGAGNISGSATIPNILWQNTKTGEIGYWTLTSGAQFNSYTQIKPPGTVSTAWHIAATPDINGDGEADLVFQNETTGEVGYWLMKNGQRQSYTQIEPPGVVSPTAWQLRGWF